MNQTFTTTCGIDHWYMFIRRCWWRPSETLTGDLELFHIESDEKTTSSSSPYFEDCSFMAETQNITKFVSLETRRRKLSRNTKTAWIWHWDLSQPKAGKTTKTSQNSGNSPMTSIQRTTFTHRIFPICTMSFQKAGSFSKMTSLSMTWLSWFVASISEPTRIGTKKLGKTVLIAEISPNALFLEAIVSYTELRIAQGQSC